MFNDCLCLFLFSSWCHIGFCCCWYFFLLDLRNNWCWKIKLFPSARVAGELNHCAISCLCSFYNHNLVIGGNICWDMSLMFVPFFYSWISSFPGPLFYINISINFISCWKDSRYIYIGAGLFCIIWGIPRIFFKYETFISWTA